MIKKILIWPNPELSKVAKPVENLDENLQVLITDLFETMAAAKGIGLAATQIGIHQRVIVLDIPDERLGVLINPEIVEYGKESHELEEGCLSVPGQVGIVNRPFTVTVKFINANGEHITHEYTDLMGRCVQHEIDHLNGKVFVQYLGNASRDLIRSKMKKIGSSYLPGEEPLQSKEK